jgi:transcriptional antiterminator RfaH
MPLLPLETFLYPDNLMQDSILSTEDTEPWWVLHARPRTEKAIARKLLTTRRDFFLPLYKKRWTSKGRVLSSYLPLFPGYLFLRGQDETRSDALATRQVARIFPVPDAARLRAELAQVYRLMLADMRMQPEERLQPGTPVYVIGGPLQGLEGRVLRRSKQLRFLVEVQLLQRGVSVEIDASMIEPVNNRMCI